MVKSISFLLFTLISIEIAAQKLNPQDSMLIRKYWNKIYPVSVTSKSGNLYVNIKNYLELKHTDGDVIPPNLLLETNNGTIEKENTRFRTVPKFAGNSYIGVYIIGSNKDTLLIGKKKITVVRIPDPCLKIGGAVINEKGSISRNELLKGDSLKLFFTEDLPESENWYNIDYFSSGYTYGGSFIYEDNKGPFFSEKAVDVIKKQLSGQELVIKILAITPKAEHFRIMPIIRFKML